MQVAVSGIYEKMLIVLYFSSLLVCSAYCNKKPWIKWLKQQFKLEVLELGGLESEYQPGWVLMRIPFQVCRQLPSCCVLHGLPLEHEWKRSLALSSYKSTNAIELEFHSYDLISSLSLLQQPHLQVQSYWGLRLQHMN